MLRCSLLHILQAYLTVSAVLISQCICNNIGHLLIYGPNCYLTVKGNVIVDHLGRGFLIYYICNKQSLIGKQWERRTLLHCDEGVPHLVLCLTEASVELRLWYTPCWGSFLFSIALQLRSCQKTRWFLLFAVMLLKYMFPRTALF